MQIDSFELTEQTTFAGFDFPYRITMRGSGLEPRSVPFDGTIGEEALWVFLPPMDGTGLVGFLIGLPGVEDELMIGYLGEPLMGTGLDGRIPG